MKKIFGLITLFCCLQNLGFAQRYNGELGKPEYWGVFKKYDGNRGGDDDDVSEKAAGKMNVVKVNLPSLVFTNISLIYERIFTQKVTGSLGVRYMPNYKIDLASNIGSIFSNSDTALNGSSANVTISNFAITPELRVYLGKRAGKGFYVGPFARYESFNLNFPFKSTLTSGKIVDVTMKGTMAGISGGVLLGAQFELGSSMVLDIFAGPYIGPKKINIKATGSSISLTPSEVTQINDIFTASGSTLEFNGQATANSIEVTSTNSQPSFRTGFCLGFRF
jgi:hypothetical protein